MSSLTWKLDADDRALLEALKRSVEGFKRVDEGARKAGQSGTEAGSAMHSSFEKLGKYFTAGAIIGGISKLTGEFVSLTKEFARMGDLADRLGMTGESVQRLSYIAQQGGTDIEVMAKSLTKMTAALNSGGPPAEKMREALGGLGINANKFISMSPEDQLYELARGFEASGGDGEAFSKTLDLVGLRAADLIPTLRMGSDALREMAANAPVISEPALDGIKKYDDAVQHMTGSLKAAVAQSSAFQYATKYVGTIADMISGKSLGQAVEANFMAPNGETDASRLVAELNAKQAAALQYGGASLKASGLLVTASSDEHRRKVNEVMAANAQKAAAEQTKTDEQETKKAEKFEKDWQNLVKEGKIAAAEKLLADATDEFQKRSDIADANNRYQYQRNKAMEFAGNAIGGEIDARAYDIAQKTGFGTDMAGKLARSDAAVAAYTQKLQSTRHYQVEQERLSRQLVREGKSAIRAREWAEKHKGDSNMGSKPIGERMKEAMDLEQGIKDKIVGSENERQAAEQERSKREQQLAAMQEQDPMAQIASALGVGGETAAALLGQLRDKFKELTKF